jgi:hypothetical protein
MENKSSFKYPITISDAINNIEKRIYLLPAIQRKFVWSSEKIEVLFDSIMRDYPINSFMMWNVTNDKTKNNYKFYEFLKEYREFFQDENPYINTKGYADFMAVIDGQQRLTSLYLGLKGSYAYKMPRKWWKDNEECLPTRKLYINLSSALKDDERKMTYDFKFLSLTDVAKLELTEDLFLLNDIYLYRDQDSLEDYMSSRSWKDPKFAKHALRKFRNVVFEDRLITYYQEENQDIDTVLDIFIRTNSGGEPLSFSNLLMSITTANWERDARKEFKALVDVVYDNNFIISADLILNGKSNALNAILLLPLGIACELFMETYTIFALVCGAVAIIYSAVNKNALFKSISFFIGGIIGAVIMFSNGIYRKIAAGDDVYQKIPVNEGGFINKIINALKSLFSTVSNLIRVQKGSL